MQARRSFTQTNVPAWVIVLAGFALNALLGVADYYTGHELVVSPVYVLPIGLVAWFAGPVLGAFTAVVSACIWLIADVIDGEYSRVLVLGVNTVVRLALFLVVTYVLWALHKTMRRLEQASSEDHLTGAANSASFYESLEREIERLGRYGRPLTLAYLDLDGFKAVNDGFGHVVGDQVLRVVAECSRARLRKTDIVGRIGGDEFAFLCPETDEEAAQAALAEVMARLGDEMNAGGWPVTFSVGAVTCHESPASAEEVLRMADDLMYSVKLASKDGIKFASLGCAKSESPLCDEQTLVESRRD
jgi:diguanylate cyclase (GGDEF)-like protein